MKPLPEFRLTLTRMEKGETACPGAPYEHEGQRSKFGGLPDRIQDGDDWPECPECGDSMYFVAQIDSIEHDSSTNPNAKRAGSVDQHWMFSDVGMIYVYYCFDCIVSHAETEFC